MDIAAADPTEQSGRRPQTLIWLLTLGMAALAALIAAPGLSSDPEAAMPGVTWFVLLPVFALAEVAVIHLPTVRNAHGHTLREIPAVLGLTLLSSQQYVTCYVVGAILALLVAARMRGVKLAFNAAMFALEAALGALVYHAILQGGDPLSPAAWVAVLVAVLVTDLLSAGAVTLAISLTEGAFDGEVLDEALRSGSVAAFINTCVALLVATLVLVQPSALPLLAVLVVLLVFGYRAYMALARGHARTHLLYRFVDRTSQARSLEEVTQAVLKEATDLMHVERAYLVEAVGDRQARCQSLESGAVRTELLTVGETTPWWWAAFGSGIVRHQSAPRASHAGDATPVEGPPLLLDPRDGLAASLRGAGAATYALVVLDRSFEKETFDDEDEHVFEVLAAHAGVAVERARTVSDLESLAGELQAARDAALAASEAKSMFLTNFGHEVRTPLSTVLAAAELLDDSPLDAGQTGLLSRIRRSGGLLLALVNDVLDFSRNEFDSPAARPASFDLHAVVTGAVSAHQATAHDRGVSLECHWDDCVPRVVEGDVVGVAKVLDHLLDNAVKFTKDGRIDVAVRAAQDDRGVCLSVSDTGIGIHERDREAIFEVFTQVDGSTTRSYEGTGLGLAICKQRTELMGGTISVDGELGVGSTFTVWLPLRPASESSETGAFTPVSGRRRG